MKAHAFEFSSLYPSAAELERSAVASEENVSRPWTAKKKRTSLAESEPTAPQALSSVEKKKKKPKKFPPENVIQTEGEKSSLSRSEKRKKSVCYVPDDFEVVTKKSKMSTSNSKSEIALAGNESRKLNNKKKKRRKEKPSESIEVTDLTEKPKKKKLRGPVEIEENLENLTIGENASTLADLLDDMKVVKKSKKRKKTDKASENKNKNKKNKRMNGNTENAQEVEEVEITKKTKKRKNSDRKQHLPSTGAVTEDGTEDTVEGVKEKVKWNQRKWNKDRRGGADSRDDLRASVLVQNLPVSLLLTYKKLLAEHFAKCGLIKRIGVAEFYPTAEPRTVFTTTVHFYSEGAADQALEEDNMELGGSRMSVRRPLPATDTTVAVRCYAGCSPHLLSSIFAPCGRVRCIREIQKGRSAIPTAFVEFDGPAGVERALGVAAEARIGGKKVVVSRYEDRSHKRSGADSEGEE